MSNVLRKKIAMAAGIAPSLIELRPFWDTLEKIVAGWAGDVFSLAPKVDLVSRQVLLENQLTRPAGDSFFYSFNSLKTKGLAGVEIDRVGSLHHYAVRLKIDDSAVSEPPSLFLQLLCQPAIADLACRFTSGILPESHGQTTAPPANASWQLDEGSNYLDLKFAYDLEEQRTAIRLVFDHAVLQRSVVAPMRSACSSSALPNEADRPRRLFTTVRASHLELTARLSQIELTVGQCSRLHPGQEILLPKADLGQITLSVETVDGMTGVAQASLGDFQKKRAAKLTSAINKDFAASLKAS